MNEPERGKGCKTEEEHADQPERPRIAKNNRLFIVALNDVKKDRRKKEDRDQKFSSDAELPSDFQNSSVKRTVFIESEEPSRKEPKGIETTSGNHSSLPQKNFKCSDNERHRNFNSPTEISPGFKNSSENRRSFQKESRQFPVAKNGDIICKNASENLMIPHRDTRSSDNEKYRQFNSHAEISSGFRNSYENRRRFPKESRQSPVVRYEDRMHKNGSENLTLPHRDTQNSDNERRRQLNYHVENSSGFRNGTENRRSFHKESKQSPVVRNENRMYKNGSENSSLPHRDTQSSGIRTTYQCGKKSQNFRNNSFEKGRSVLTENKLDFNKSSNQKHFPNFKVNSSVYKGNLSHMKRANSQDSIVDYYGNWDSVEQSEFSVDRKETQNERHASKDTSLIHSKTWGSCESVVNFYKPNRNLEKTWPHDKYESENKREFERENSSSRKTNFSTANHNRPHQGPHRSESFSKPYGKVNGMKIPSRDKSFSQESQWKQYDHRPKFRGKLEKESDFSSPHAHSGRKNFKEADVAKRHLNSDKDPMVQNHLTEGISSQNLSKGEKDLNTGDYERNSNCKNNDDFIKDHHHTSGMWDSTEESLPDEPLVSENMKVKPEIALDKEIPRDVCLDQNTESLKSPISFACDIDPNLFQKEGFFTPCNEELVPIPAPHPAQDGAVHIEITALPNEGSFTASSENQVCVEKNCTDSNGAVCMLETEGLPNDDSFSVSSGNRNSFENSYAASNEAEDSDSEESSNIEESEYELPPEHAKAITKYLKEIETDRSVPTDIAKKILFDVNKVLRYRLNGNEVSLYGSYLSGIALSTSNLNLALKSNQPLKSSFLLTLQKILYKDMVDYEVMPFEEEGSLKESKICFYEPDKGVTCEIMYSGKTVSDFCRTSKLLKSICEYDARIKTLIIASRVWAEVCVIHETENGQLHPVGFALLVVHFLQQMDPPVLPLIDVTSKNWGLKSLPTKNNSEIGELWYEFLKYYSHTFNWGENVVTVTCKDPVSKSSLEWKNCGIAIQDPCSMKNVASTVITFENTEYIFSCFKAYYNFFLVPNNSDSDSDETGLKSSDKEWRYSFKESSLNRPVLEFCVECEELEDELCEKCRIKNLVLEANLEKLPELNEISMNCIDKALKEVYSDLILSDKNMVGRKAFVEDLENYVRKIYPDAQLTLFGSSVNKFGIKNSDLDICLTFHKSRKHLEERKILKRISSHLRKNPMYSGIFCLPSAKVPLVKFYCPTQKWNCDLCLYNVLSVHNSKLLSRYAEIDERCRILGCALKHLAMKGWIAESSAKTLNSYSYILMVIHYLQQTEPPVLPVLPLQDQEVFVENRDIPPETTNGKNYWFFEGVDELRKRYQDHPLNEATIAELWLGFFEYYLKFDNDYAVTITQREPMLASELIKHARLFNIEDPFIYKRNLGCIISDDKVSRTLKVFENARSLFGHNIPSDKMENPRAHYFSSNNLTGQFVKEMECTACGAFDHEKEDCLKANPFKKYNIRIKNLNTSFPLKRRQ